MKMRHVLSVLLAALPLGGAAYGAGGAGSETPSQPGSTIQVAMTLYAGGLTLGHVDLNTTIRGDQYHSVSNLQTGGVVNVVWQSEIQATSNGTVAPNSFHPALYDSFYTGRSDKKQEVSLTYDNGGPVKLYANPAYPTTGYEVPPDQQKNTFDPLSAITYFVSGVHMASADNPCGVLLPVFDGRRRYDVGFEKVKDVTVSMDNGLYKGKAVLCQMHYKQIAGYKPRVLKEGAKFPLISAWITTMPSAITGRSYVVPLRVWADTEYGVIAAVTNKLLIDGVTPKT
ncbi:MAG: DUF3108 domain-containing protein [Alphaproteobacteria bacterium]|nr:DUF3108 domain-containing protein [Alphaproteobacteria bacterium]MBL7098568.1 DUF3108 domain-containing protein [Alphaproteobacteria bacterium]